VSHPRTSESSIRPVKTHKTGKQYAINLQHKTTGQIILAEGENNNATPHNLCKIILVHAE
jgi:hypothetical protein